jgi:hypothetical protein
MKTNFHSQQPATGKTCRKHAAIAAASSATATPQPQSRLLASFAGSSEFSLFSRTFPEFCQQPTIVSAPRHGRCVANSARL